MVATDPATIGATGVSRIGEYRGFTSGVFDGVERRSDYLAR